MSHEEVYHRLVMRPSAGQLRNLLASFGVLHSTNTALNILYSLALLLSVSRALPQDQYAQVVFLTAISFYFQPIDQVLGRISFVELRASVVKNETPKQYVIVVLGIQIVVLTVASICIPFAIAYGQGSGYQISYAFYLLFALLTNFWAFDLQSTAFALEMGGKFVRWSLLHRLCQFAVLSVLWLSASFSIFASLAAGLFVAFSIFACAALVRQINLQRPPSTQVSWQGRVQLIATSFISGLADLLILNVPYAVVSFTYGVGSTLVVFDSVMKVARLVMAGSRTLAEIGLPRHSRFVVQLDVKSANRLFSQLVVLCVLASAVPAAVVAINTPLVFSLLLGPNNIVPAGAAMPISIIIVATGLYQPASMLMSFTNDYFAIRRFALAVSSISVLVFGAIAMFKPEPIQLLWYFAALLVMAGTVAAVRGRCREREIESPPNC
jgi:O-antigen/teichoic acid export membrane protein